MKDRLDPLIEDRAKWLFSSNPFARTAKAGLNGLLGYQHTLDLGEALKDKPASEIMDHVAARLARQVQVTGLEHIPAHGAALIVANHPTGIADGVMLWHALATRRPDLFYFANHDILRVLPQMEALIAPVEWREEKRTRAKTRATMDYMRAAMAEDRLGVIFPSGRLAKRRGLRLHERPWMASAAMMARKFDLPVIPINIRARNSALFYLFDVIHPSLRDITLFHETLNKHRQPYRITIGAPITPADLPAQASDGIEVLRAATLALGGQHAPAVSLLDSSRPLAWPKGTAPAAT
ncbi:lysophospholipid acyltransferase family protein [Pseudoruegeria sp. SHC-113]|uniref:lysophospholipid acyltransferase family protein n=1 Tax=Pseudoruegeria sp. SHC-113 TaxID=2855439 RepID=UPI0021BB4709|nr:lysophospholipid acyltransferase family protein [Pseudoruegeria sp. SHC-113]MCT8159710.1 lysophospholipid acyltransferase family protein [Pseudoruegeria sp. SHC-113]